MCLLNLHEYVESVLVGMLELGQDVQVVTM